MTALCRLEAGNDDMDIVATSMAMETVEAEAEGAGRGSEKRRRESASSLSAAPSRSSIGECDIAKAVGAASATNGDVISIRGPEPPSKKCRRMGSYRRSATTAVESIGNSVMAPLPVPADELPKSNFVALRRVSECTDVDVQEEAPVSISSDSETSRQEQGGGNVCMPSIARASPIILPLHDAEQYKPRSNRSKPKRAIVTPSSSFLIGAKDFSIADASRVNSLLRREQSPDVKLSVSQPSACGEKNASEGYDSVAGDLVATKNPSNVSREKVQSSTKTKKARTQFSRITKVLIFFASLIFLKASLLVADKLSNLAFDQSFSLEQPVHPDSIYVPGGGFSGFWFTLGRLKSVPNPADKVYYCYSAGCLGVVATLSNRTMWEMWDLAFGVQRMWKDGKIDRYDVTTRFVNGLLHLEDEDQVHVEGGENATVSCGIVNSQPMDDANLLSKINIVTTTKDETGVRHMIRSPKDIFELKEMLVQTTWIPFVTGGELWTKDSSTGEHHMDGAFSTTTHPKCAHHLGLPCMFCLFMNILNVNLGFDKVEKYWNAGIELGV